MSRREKLLDKMRHTPAAIRFSEVEVLLRYEGFVLFTSAAVTVPTIVRMAGS